MNRRSQPTPVSEVPPDLDPSAWPVAWQQHWEVKEDGSSAPRIWHRSGLCFFFEFEQVDDKGNWAWVVYDDDISQSRLFELQAEMGEEAFNIFTLLLGRQAKTLWEELGHDDFSLVR
jgi:hypothetical protein